MHKYFKLVFKLLFTIAGLCLSVSLHAQQKYRLSGTNRIGISGTSTLSDWVVKTSEIAGEMIFIPPAKDAAGKSVRDGVINEAKVLVQVSGIRSEKGETMDNKMYKALKSQDHPEIVFALGKPVLILKTTEKVSASGNLEIAGVTRPMTFDLTIARDGNRFHLQGTKSMKLSEFEIDPPTAMFGQIVTGNDIVVDLDLSFKPIN